MAVVGGGAAGIIAAWRAASFGARVVLLEKTPRLGTKILISGGGKCNITHDGDLKDVLKAFRANEAQFIRPSCYRFTNMQIIEMLTSRGLQVYTRPDGRIFPVDKTAKEVVAILRSYLDEVRVDVRLNTPVEGILAKDGIVGGVKLADSDMRVSKVIIGVGGSSYPNSGTTGDGWKWAKQLGHTIVKVRAALAPIYIKDPRPERSGIALRDCVLKARQDGKEIARWRGDLLFTHQGISGPTALGISRAVAENEANGEISLQADLQHDKSFEILGAELAHFIEMNPRKSLATFAEQFIPNRLVDGLLTDAGIDLSMPSSQVEKKARNRLIEMIKGWPIGIVRTVPLEKGEVVAGGIALDEVDPQTMESKKIKGLYLCGEALDIAGPVGGYNLQAAFATGYIAGESAARAI